LQESSFPLVFGGFAAEDQRKKDICGEGCTFPTPLCVSPKVLAKTRRRMKIAKIEQFFPRVRTRLVKITTDNGLIGWGETTLEGKPKSTTAAVEEIADYLVGKDPLTIEHHWQHIYRSAFFRGGNILMSALAGIDQA